MEEQHASELDDQALSWCYEYSVKHNLIDVCECIEGLCKAENKRLFGLSSFVYIVRILQCLSKSNWSQDDLQQLLQVLEDILRHDMFQQLRRFYRALIHLYFMVKLLDDTYKADIKKSLQALHMNRIQNGSEIEGLLVIKEDIISKCKTSALQKVQRLLSSLLSLFPNTALDHIIADKDNREWLGRQDAKSFYILLENLKNRSPERAIREVVRFLHEDFSTLKKKEVYEKLSDHSLSPDDMQRTKENLLRIPAVKKYELNEDLGELDVRLNGRIYPTIRADCFLIYQRNPDQVSSYSSDEDGWSSEGTGTSDGDENGDSSDGEENGNISNKRNKKGNCNGSSVQHLDVRQDIMEVTPDRHHLHHANSQSSRPIPGDDGRDKPSIEPMNSNLDVAKVDEVLVTSGASKTLRATSNSEENVEENLNEDFLNVSGNSNVASKNTTPRNLAPELDARSKQELEMLITETEALLQVMKEKLRALEQKDCEADVSKETLCNSKRKQGNTSANVSGIDIKRKGCSEHKKQKPVESRKDARENEAGCSGALDDLISSSMENLDQSSLTTMSCLSFKSAVSQQCLDTEIKKSSGMLGTVDLSSSNSSDHENSVASSSLSIAVDTIESRIKMNYTAKVMSPSPSKSEEWNLTGDITFSLRDNSKDSEVELTGESTKTQKMQSAESDNLDFDTCIENSGSGNEIHLQNVSQKDDRCERDGPNGDESDNNSQQDDRYEKDGVNIHESDSDLELPYDGSDDDTFHTVPNI